MASALAGTLAIVSIGILMAHAMDMIRALLLQRVEADQQDNSKVLNFRPRTLTGSRDRKDIIRSDEDICRLFDFSRYEMRRESSDDFRRRMVANLAALVLLTTFAALAAVDVYDIARMERCAQTLECGRSGH
jgi:uncharacterized membrane protein YdfJ with MMPL/SSD domain